MISFLYILGGILSLVALLLVAALFTKKSYSIACTVTIDKPRQIVFDYVKQLKNQKYYSKWVMMDPDVKIETKGTDGTVGFVSAWTSENKKVGKGEQEITAITEGERIDTALRFIKPMPGVASSYMSTAQLSPSRTLLTWGLSSGMAYPMNIMLLLLGLENMLKKDLETGLENLKQVLEKQ